jgi:predicted MFS family arabinose efflux permease
VHADTSRGHETNTHLHGWQAIYLVVGLITVLSVPLIWFTVDSDVAHARFLDDHEKSQAIERLRANQTGTGSNEFKWGQALEMFMDTKSYLFMAMALLLNIGAAVTNAFGPTLIANFGFDAYTSTLLNMPFGALQFICIILASYLAQKFKLKSAILVAFMIPVVVGLALLYVEAAGKTFHQGPALAGYYLLAFLYGGNPLIVSWMVANTAGQTKKSTTISLYNAASAAGNIVGPLLFQAKDKNTHYLPGVKAVLAIFCVQIGVVGLTVINLYVLNRIRQNQRVKNGKPKYINDTSMTDRYATFGADDAAGVLGQNGMFTTTACAWSCWSRNICFKQD